MWVGLKFVVRDTTAGAVQLDLHRDLTDDAAGGTWEYLNDTADAGGWVTEPRTGCKPSDRVLTGTAASVFLRNTKAVIEHRAFSIREIAGA